ncbi:Ca2+ sensor (EF-Hand superfamily) [Pseudoloma neurophilia]|uniref:Ca2+ sensor (EF-Hand superfamily) n=1 Tax=Pseudoloma neurophilia TaxID=146866 RepID=A0A0R0LX05_9MICR|nr:Ca2+ sensor (EF-Hand superfamily) [Pseudoloma neurophilia]
MGSRLSTPALNASANTRRKFSHFNEKDLKKWESQFNQLFPTGYMTEKDMITFMSRLFPFGQMYFASLLYKTINISNTGQIDFSELLIAYSILKKGSVHEKLRWIFRLYDTDSDGVISKDEMETVITHYMEMSRPSTYVSPDSTLDSNNICFDVPSFVDKIFKESQNESGFLSFDDFKLLAQKRMDILEMFEIFE